MHGLAILASSVHWGGYEWTGSYTTIDLIAASTNALNGALLARRPDHFRNFTVVGILLMALLGGLGGGITRDVLVGEIPSALTNPAYIFLALFFGVLVFTGTPVREIPHRLRNWGLDEEEIAQFAQERGLPQDIAELSRRPEVRELIQAEVDRANARYAQAEQVKKFAILDHDLSQETGELTPTLKVKRNIVNDKYADLFDSLYG